MIEVVLVNKFSKALIYRRCTKSLLYVYMHSGYVYSCVPAVITKPCVSDKLICVAHTRFMCQAHLIIKHVFAMSLFMW